MAADPEGALFDLAPCGLAILDADYRITQANRYFHELVGRPDDGAAGLRLPELLTPAARIFAMTRLQQDLALMGRVEELVLDVVRPDRLRVPVMLNAVQARDPGGGPGRIRLAVWRAAAKRAYEAEVPKARKAAADAARVKGDVLANLSHEMRTPLNGVTAAAGLLASGELTPMQRDLVGIIQRSGDQATRLLSDLLDLSRVQAGELSLDLTAFDPAAELAGPLELARLEAQAKGLGFEAELVLPPGCRRIGDPVRLRQVLAALLSNAVRFTAAGQVRARIALDGDGLLQLTVEDTGIGFDMAEAARLFEAFEQAETGNDRRAGGAGLGLAICQGIVRLMNGSLEARSEPGRGSVFTVRLPLQAAEPAPAPAPAASAEPHAGPLRILLVEDNPTNRQVAALILDALGVQLAMAENGAEGVQAWRDQAFDIVLMDLQMPVMDGLTAIREIRRLETELPARGRTRIVVLSANAMADHQRQSAEAGADLHLAKPITPPGLIGGIQAALNLPAETAVGTAARA